MERSPTECRESGTSIQYEDSEERKKSLGEKIIQSKLIWKVISNLASRGEAKTIGGTGDVRPSGGVARKQSDC